jgi:hypothetical protein
VIDNALGMILGVPPFTEFLSRIATEAAKLLKSEQPGSRARVREGEMGDWQLNS